LKLLHGHLSCFFYHERQQELVDQQPALAHTVISDNQVGPCAACGYGMASTAKRVG
jgi:hypothetical protein